MYFIIRQQLIHLYISDDRGFMMLRHHFLNKAMFDDDSGTEWYHYVMTPHFFSTIERTLLANMTQMAKKDVIIYDERVPA